MVGVHARSLLVKVSGLAAKLLGEADIQCLLDFFLAHIATLKLPKKRGAFVEFRNYMISVLRWAATACSRKALRFSSSTRTKVREKMIADLAKCLQCSIGGQFSFDVFPHGWDETNCIRTCVQFSFRY